MDEIPAWAMEQARKIMSGIFPHYSSIILSGNTDDLVGDIKSTARVGDVKSIAIALIASYERGFTDGRDDVTVEAIEYSKLDALRLNTGKISTDDLRAARRALEAKP